MSLKKENCADEGVYTFNMSMLIASVILCCLACVLFFM